MLMQLLKTSQISFILILGKNFTKIVNSMHTYLHFSRMNDSMATNKKSTRGKLLLSAKMASHNTSKSCIGNSRPKSRRTHRLQKTPCFQCRAKCLPSLSLRYLLFSVQMLRWQYIHHSKLQLKQFIENEYNYDVLNLQLNKYLFKQLPSHFQILNINITF